MYDHPPSPLASVVALSSNTKHSRSHSPIPHISTLHHLHHHGSSSQYSPSSRKADISRLLDPSYAPSSDAASSSRSVSPSRQQTHAYVDHRGDLHDPDYRDFPVLPPSKRQQQQQQKAKRQRRSASAHSSLYPHRIASSTTTSTTRHDRYSSYPLVARPDWERDWATEIEDLDEDDDEELDSQDVHSPFSLRSSSSSSSSARTPTSRRASLPPSVYAHSSFYYSEPPTMTMSTTSSPVGSLEEQEEEEIGESPFGDLEEAGSGSSPSRCKSLLKHVKRTSSRCSGNVETSAQQEKQEEMNDDEGPFASSPRRDDADHTPSCTYALRQQWQAFSLRLRFGLFNAKRRLSTTTRRRKTM